MKGKFESRLFLDANSGATKNGAHDLASGREQTAIRGWQDANGNNVNFEHSAKKRQNCVVYFPDKLLEIIGVVKYSTLIQRYE